jgi:hypothetical protein
MKEQEIRAKLKEMRVGEPERFSTQDPDVFVEVERIIIGIEDGWMIDHQGERMVTKELDEAVRYIAKHWNIHLKKMMHLQFSELEEIEDLGEY